MFPNQLLMFRQLFYYILWQEHIFVVSTDPTLIQIHPVPKKQSIHSYMLYEFVHLRLIFLAYFICSVQQ